MIRTTNLLSAPFRFFVGLLIAILATSAMAEEFFTIKDGELQRPTGFHEWIFLASPVTPNDLNDGMAPFPEFHSVYMDPKSWAVWKDTGEFREGAILMKELISVGAKEAASGKGYFAGEVIGLEATIKSKKLFPDEPGNWAYFSFTTPDHKTLKTSVAAFPTASCNACHAANAAGDFVFSQYYPVLRGAKAAGELGTGGKRSDLSN